MRSEANVEGAAGAPLQGPFSCQGRVPGASTQRPSLSFGCLSRS
jgi:hypothetical protein